jgi:bifunctional non-homologous end joining protein LigD
MPPETAVRIEGKELKLSNLDKVLYPEARFTKAQVIDYYAKISPVLLTHLKDRPITLKRYPHGVTGEFFYEKQCPSYRPPWVPVSKRNHREGHADVRYCVVNDLPSLVWIANLASLELHVLLSFRQDPSTPTMVMFDFDPGPSMTVVDAAALAIEMRRVLDGMGLESFPKTSGGKGVHVAVPLNVKTDFDATKAFARGMAERLEGAFPGKVTSNMRKSLRPGKIFVDWSQNSEHKTTVCAYSLRARETPSVSTPVDWKELVAAVKKKDASLLAFTPEKTLARVKKMGDLYAPVARLKQKLPKKTV